MRNAIKSSGTQSLYGLLTAVLICMFCTPALLATESNLEAVPKTGKLAQKRAQHVGNIKVMTMNGSLDPQTPSDSATALINQFYIDQFRHFNDPEAPYFMLMSRDASLALGVGGTISADGWFDWHGSIPDLGFRIYDIPVPNSSTHKRKLAASMANSGLFFTLLGRNNLLGRYKAFISMQFSGYPNSKFEIDKAYFMFRNFTVGRSTSTFADPMASPPSTDDAGNNGHFSRTNILVRYMRTTSNHHITYAGGLEFPNQEVKCDDDVCAENDPYLPDAAGFIQYQWDEGESHVRLCGLARMLTYRDLIKKSNEAVFGWGVQLSSVCNISYPITLYAIASYGKGTSSYLSDLSGNNYDLVPDNRQDGRLFAPETFAGLFALKYNFTPNIYSDLVYSGVRYFPRGHQVNNEYKSGLYYSVNLIWEVTTRLMLGAEYLHGQRNNFGGEYGTANRINTLFRLHF